MYMPPAADTPALRKIDGEYARHFISSPSSTRHDKLRRGGLSSHPLRTQNYTGIGNRSPAVELLRFSISLPDFNEWVSE